MKKLVFALITLSVAFGAFAQERVMLDREDLDINSHEAILVRTKNSPSKISIDMLVPMSEPVCERYDTRYVMRTSAALCGVVRERRVGMDRVCVKFHPNGQCAVYERRQVETWIDHPRTCSVPETFCAVYGTATDFERDGVKIKFKNAHALADGQEETFLIRARQKNMGGENVVYDIQPVDTVGAYEVNSKGWFGIDSYEIKGK